MRLIGLAITVLALSGCACHYQDIRLVSDPPGARVKVQTRIDSWAARKTTTDGEGTTPYTVNIARGPHELIVTFAQDGCPPISKTYQPVCDAGKYAAGFLFVGIGPAYSFPDEITAHLAPADGPPTITERWETAEK